MKFVLFYHSLVSDWNHGNAHFLRGIASELLARGHAVDVYEPADGWSRRHLLHDHGLAPLQEFARHFPQLRSHPYDEHFDLELAVEEADVVIAHEWNSPQLIAQLGRLRRGGNFRLLFHDTHHRSVSAMQEMARYDLRDYDGVLAFGEAIRQRYIEYAWCARVWTWHEAADVRVFRPQLQTEADGDVIWIGNWGDGERSRELHEFLIEPVRRLGVSARVHGVRYPAAARASLARARIEHCGWLPNWRVPETFGARRVTLHIPRAPYVRTLPGIPTIRVFEALACGIPLICAPWTDAEHLFAPGEDFLVARDGTQMQRHIRAVLNDSALALELATQGIRTIHARHTCAHRVKQLFEILAELGSARVPGNTHSEHPREEIHV